MLAELAAGERTIFELARVPVEPALAALAAGEAATVPSRAYLRATLALLAEQRRMELDETTGTVHRAGGSAKTDLG